MIKTDELERLTKIFEELDEAHIKVKTEEATIRDQRYKAAKELADALKEDAKDQIGAVIRINGEEHKITSLGVHWADATMLIPHTVMRIKSGEWGRRPQPTGLGWHVEKRKWCKLVKAGVGGLCFEEELP